MDSIEQNYFDAAEQYTPEEEDDPSTETLDNRPAPPQPGRRAAKVAWRSPLWMIVLIVM